MSPEVLERLARENAEMTYLVGSYIYIYIFATYVLIVY